VKLQVTGPPAAPGVVPVGSNWYPKKASPGTGLLVAAVSVGCAYNAIAEVNNTIADSNIFFINVEVVMFKLFAARFVPNNLFGFIGAAKARAPEWPASGYFSAILHQI
jgi:hypothetical protein